MRVLTETSLSTIISLRCWLVDCLTGQYLVLVHSGSDMLDMFKCGSATVQHQ